MMSSYILLQIYIAFENACKTASGRTTLVNFINILRAHFVYKSAFLPKSFCQSQNVTREKLRQALLYEKCARKMLMKLTT